MATEGLTSGTKAGDVELYGIASTGPAKGGWLSRAASRFGGALANELEDRRGFLFTVIAFGVGVALYFGAEHEPLPYAALVPAVLFLGLAMALRSRPAACYAFAGLAAIACGFAVASFQVQRLAHPVLAQTQTAVLVSGFVESSERRERGSRLTLLVTGFDRPIPDPPHRVRVTLGGRNPPEVGSHVTLRATLSPPPGPAWPGGFDFGRAVWFDGIGATGFALGRATLTPVPRTMPATLVIARWLDRQRRDMAARISDSLSGAAGAVAIALVTGLRDAVPEPVEESMRISGLSHVLSISGLHMALVATTVFFLVRGLLALFPPLALHAPLKALAAVPAALATTWYLLLSGADVPTQRSYVMTLLVLAGVMAARPALTLRTLALAAVVVLVLTPWAILDPGAQMSFAATLALVAGYERFSRRLSAPIGTVAGGGVMAVPVRFIAALVLTSLVAGFATAPYAAYHFHRLAPLSLLANLAAMPLVSFIIMPAGLLGCLLMPFGWDDLAWRLMGWGIDAMIAVSDAVAALPGADRGIKAMPLVSLVLLSLALIAFCLLRTRLVLIGFALAGTAFWLGWRAPMPDVLVDTRAQTVAVRGADGRLRLMGDRDSRLERRFAVEQWRSMAGERAMPMPLPDDSLTARCDLEGCTLRTAGDDVVALSRAVGSLSDDCRLASLLITTVPPPAGCQAHVVYVDPRRQVGGLALHASQQGGWRRENARPDAPRRLWHPGFPAGTSQAPSRTSGAAEAKRSAASEPAGGTEIEAGAPQEFSDAAPD